MTKQARTRRAAPSLEKTQPAKSGLSKIAPCTLKINIVAVFFSQSVAPKPVLFRGCVFRRVGAFPKLFQESDNIQNRILMRFCIETGKHWTGPTLRDSDKITQNRPKIILANFGPFWGSFFGYFLSIYEGGGPNRWPVQRFPLTILYLSLDIVRSFSTCCHCSFAGLSMFSFLQQ